MNAESNGVVDEDGEGAADGAAVGAADPPPGPKPHVSRAPKFIKASRPLHMTWQAGVFLVGLAIVIGGIIMLPLPGPGWVVIFGGMAVWATEFAWAHHVLRWTKRRLSEALKRMRAWRSRGRSRIG